MYYLEKGGQRGVVRKEPIRSSRVTYQLAVLYVRLRDVITHNHLLGFDKQRKSGETEDML